ncbi:MAG: ERCC4 domain-containing protein [Candidatus Omnitrophota bacterium]
MIKIDYRELSSNIRWILEKEYGIMTTEQFLKVGDYIVNDEIVIERKTTVDFVRSIIDGRLFIQALRMSKSFDVVLFIVEGKDLYNTGIDIHEHSVKGALISLALAWRIPVLFTLNIEETALLLSLIAKKRMVSCENFFVRRGRQPKRLRKKQLYVLQGLPGVGPKLACHLLDVFGSIEVICAASEKELIKVGGVGKIKAKAIKKTVSNQ